MPTVRARNRYERAQEIVSRVQMVNESLTAKQILERIIDAGMGGHPYAPHNPTAVGSRLTSSPRWIKEKTEGNKREIKWRRIA